MKRSGSSFYNFLPLAVVLLLLLLEQSRWVSSCDTIQISVAGGKLEGVSQKSIADGGDYCAFKGIPYGKPPVGELRFRDPLPAEPWQGVLDAKSYAAQCPQFCMMQQKVMGEEDCLYLNVFTKKADPSLKRPVMMAIYFGGFIFGSGDDSFYGPDYFMRKDVVLVTVNYRQGAFGFLNLKDKLAPGNQGMKDLVLALKWIQENIAAFGGDPGSVTVFGQSSGGAVAHYLAISPMSKGLLHKAIAQSGVAINPWALPHPRAAEIVYEICEKLGNPTKDHAQIMDFLRTVDYKKIIDVQRQLVPYPQMAQMVAFPFSPNIDAESDNPFFPDCIIKRSTAGAHVPLMIGHTNREGISFYRLGNYEDFDKDIESQIHPYVVMVPKHMYGLADMSGEKLKSFYFGDDKITADNQDKLIDLLGDAYITEGVHRVVNWQVTNGKHPTYFYRYDYDKGFSLSKMELKSSAKGAAHGDELSQQFRMNMIEKFTGAPLIKDGSIDFKMMERIIEMWVNFATTGEPNPTKTDLVPVEWEPVKDGKNFEALIIDEDMKMDKVNSLLNRYSS
ncbi:esterase FE4 [Trichogramma pretiosum]|uniref:esterase FE4 n=1 Tax=Trichogramma pretiosum TaxID=7493 RepID=UPI0006C97868|nr:esterase FE4 [Trichogramma pretiosum]